MRQLTKEVLKVKKKQRNKDKTKNQVKSQINYTAKSSLTIVKVTKYHIIEK